MSSALDRRSLPDFDARTLEMPPIERAETIPASWYVDDRFHVFDREALFSQHWQYVGPVSDVEAPGDYVQVNAGNPVVIVRDKESQLRGFYNVCRHRGGPLVMDDCGHTNVLQCKYHGWTYLLDGSLRGVPKFNRAELFDQKDYGLVPVRVVSWQGLMFVTLADDPIPLPDLVDGIAERIAPMQLGALRFAQRATYEVACNWRCTWTTTWRATTSPSSTPSCATCSHIATSRRRRLRTTRFSTVR